MVLQHSQKSIRLTPWLPDPEVSDLSDLLAPPTSRGGVNKLVLRVRVFLYEFLFFLTSLGRNHHPVPSLGKP
jgi:hypothetical protein